MTTITLSEDQGRAVMQLLDLATKAGGLQVALVALPIAQDIERQLAAPNPPAPDTD